MLPEFKIVSGLVVHQNGFSRLLSDVKFDGASDNADSLKMAGAVQCRPRQFQSTNSGFDKDSTAGAEIAD